MDFRQDSIVLSLSCKEEIDTCSLRALVLDTVCKLIRPIWLVAKLTSHLELNIKAMGIAALQLQHYVLCVAVVFGLPYIIFQKTG